MTLLFLFFFHHGSMKYFFLLSVFLCLAACDRELGYHDGVVRILGSKEDFNIVQWMGVCVYSGVILTSAHIVRDDTINYQLRMNHHEWVSTDALVIERDNETDIAYLTMKSRESWQNIPCQSPKKYIWKIGLTPWDRIYIPVIRSGSMTTLSGSVTAITGTLLAYDTSGRIQQIHDMVMTDIDLQPWDSGSPILDTEGRVIDVVHVR